MKKRILSCFMALALCLTLLPATVLAEAGHNTHPICGETCSHTDPTHPDNAFANANWLASYTGRLSVKTPTSILYGDSLTEDPNDNNCVLLKTGCYNLSTTADGCDDSYVKSKKTIKIQGEVTICLNGKEIQKIVDNTVSVGPLFEVPAGSTLTLPDHTGNGKVIGNDKGSGVYVNGDNLKQYSSQINKN